MTVRCAGSRRRPGLAHRSLVGLLAEETLRPSARRLPSAWWTDLEPLRGGRALPWGWYGARSWQQRSTHPGRCVCWRDSRNKFVVVSSSSCITLVPYYVAPVRAPRGDCMVLGQGGRGLTNGAAIKGRKSWAWPCHDRVSKTAQSESNWRWARAAHEANV